MNATSPCEIAGGDAVAFRPATEHDLADVLRLYAQPAMDNGQVLDIDQARALFARFARYPDYTLWIVQHAGRTVGTYALLIMDNLGHLGTPSAIVEDVVVDPDCQGRGIGRQMMAHALGIARAKGCYKLALSSNRRRVDAHRFYESLGFERHGVSFVVTIEPTAREAS